MQEYTVQRGDNLTKIAQMFGLDSWRKIWNANRETIPNPDVIKPGQKIKIPGGGRKKAPVPPPNPGPVPEPVDEQEIENTFKQSIISLNACLAALGPYHGNIAIGQPAQSARYAQEFKEGAFREPIEKKVKKFIKFFVELETENKKLNDKLFQKYLPLMKGLKAAVRYLWSDPAKHIDAEAKYSYTAPRAVVDPKGKDFRDSLNNVNYRFVDDNYTGPTVGGKKMEGFLFGGKDRDGNVFRSDIDVMSMIELGVAYGFGIFPIIPGKKYEEKYITMIIKRVFGLKFGEGVGVPGRPKMRNRFFNTKHTLGRIQKQAFQKALNDFMTTGRGMQENKIIQEYILKNTPQPPKDVSVIEIIADEVNETLNNLPEVQLASEILSEDELKKLFSPFAKKVVMNVYGQIGEKIKGMTVEQALLPQETLINLIDQAGLDNLSAEDRKKLLKLLLNADPDNLEPVDDLEPEDIPDGTGEEEEDES